MTLSLYDTLTRAKRRFTPQDPDRVTMYVCGPTVYNFAHIGNFRPVVVFDLLFRLLRSIYGEAAVLYAANVTDVDDKINRKAAEEGVPIREIADNAVWTYEDPIEGSRTIAGLLAFDPTVVEVYPVDDAVVNPKGREDASDRREVDEIVQHTDSGSGATQREPWAPNVSGPEGGLR